MSFMLLGILNSQAAGGGLPSPTAGFWFGGSETLTSSGERFDFNTEVRTVASFTLRLSLRTPSSFSDAGVAGYYAGGNNSGSPTSNVDKVDFATETRSATTSLAAAAYGVTSDISNRAVAAYITNRDDEFVGWTKFAFPTDTRSYFSSGGPYRSYFARGATNFAVAGYYMGGASPYSGYDLDDIGKINYSSETWSVLTSKLPDSNGGDKLGVSSNSGTAAYYRPGFSIRTRLYKMPYSTETFSLISSSMTASQATGGGLGNTGVAGYWGGGDNDLTNKIDKVNFVNDSVSTNYRTLSSSTYGLTGISNGGANV